MTATLSSPDAASGIVSLAQALVRHPSEQSDQMEADPAVVSLISDVIAPWLSARGIGFERDGMGNLIAGIGDTETGPHLMFVCYAMTHPAGRMTGPFDGELIDIDGESCLRGRGVSEQKGAMASALSAFAYLYADGGPRAGRVSLAVVTAGETGRHDAVASVVDHLGGHPDHAVIVLGTGGAVAIGNRGRIDVDVEIAGRAAHSSTPERGIDAIRGARAAMDRLDALADSWPQDTGTMGRRTLTVTAIESSPGATHTIQDRVRMTIDRRLLPDDDPDTALAEIRTALDGMAPWAVDVTLGPVMYPAREPADSALVRAIAASATDIGLEPPSTAFSQAALDAGYFQKAGAGAVMWGPGDMNQFHSEEEHVALSALVEGARRYRALIDALCL
ncbi:M20/M25/M40 family metallo-hydrolase [Fodinicurvata sp. EGI_FJ10296]|uniref:M20 family metallopeptidase n=1 Tax=Fodinicurvata sp. EGI_FJ10296 TaxID=3231908 RepID=UPI0034533128